MKQWVLACTFLIILAGCSRTETIEIKDDKGRLSEKYNQDKKTGQKQGLYQSFFENGKLKEQATYSNGELNGERTFYFVNGNLLSKEFHEKGLFSGKYQKFHEDGQLSGEGLYENNEMTGTWKRWYPDGHLMEEVTFAANQENGPFREFHPNGKLKTEGQYLNGEYEHGELKKYDENGELYERMYCENGICLTVWNIEKGDIKIDSSRIRKLAELKKQLQTNGEN